jgi:hypothetical protein
VVGIHSTLISLSSNSFRKIDPENLFFTEFFISDEFVLFDLLVDKLIDECNHRDEADKFESGNDFTAS